MYDKLMTILNGNHMKNTKTKILFRENGYENFPAFDCNKFN